MPQPKGVPDAGDSAAFLGFFYTSAESCSQTESTPAPAQVTQTDIKRPKPYFTREKPRVQTWTGLIGLRDGWFNHFQEVGYRQSQGLVHLDESERINL